MSVVLAKFKLTGNNALYMPHAGIPVAFASACAEFNYPHFGIPERSEL